MKLIKTILLFLFCFPIFCQNTKTITVIVKDNFGKPLPDVELTLLFNNFSKDMLPIRTDKDGIYKALVNDDCRGGDIELNSNSKYRLSSSKANFVVSKSFNTVNIVLTDEKEELIGQRDNLRKRLEKEQKKLTEVKEFNKQKVNSLLRQIDILREQVENDSILLALKDKRLDKQDTTIRNLEYKVTEIEKAVKDLLSRIGISQEKLFNYSLTSEDLKFEKYNKAENSIEFSFKLLADTTTNQISSNMFYLDKQTAVAFNLALVIEIEQINTVTGKPDEKDKNRDYPNMKTDQGQPILLITEFKVTETDNKRFKVEFKAHRDNIFHEGGGFLGINGVSYQILLHNNRKYSNKIYSPNICKLIDFNAIVRAKNEKNKDKNERATPICKANIRLTVPKDSLLIQVKDIGQYNDAVLITLDDAQSKEVKLNKDFQSISLNLNGATNYCLKIAAIKQSEGVINVRINGENINPPIQFSKTQREYIIDIVRSKQ
jgi:hypothetical protein